MISVQLEVFNLELEDQYKQLYQSSFGRAPSVAPLAHVDRDIFIILNDKVFVQDLIPDIIPEEKKALEFPEEFEDEDYDDD